MGHPYPILIWDMGGKYKWDGMASKHTNSLVQKISHQNFLSKTFVLLKKSQDEWHNKIQVYKFSHLKNTITNQNFFLKDSRSISPMIHHIKKIQR